MKEHYFKLFQYNEWANNRVLEALILEDYKNERILQLFSHLISVQRRWLDRIAGRDAVYEIWNMETIEGCIKSSKENSAEYLKYIETLEDDKFREMVHYANTDGKEFDTSMADILTHVINHSTYHRAQIAALLRSENLNAPVTDYIFYTREK